MDVWFHHENPYPFVPQEVLDRADSVRASLPNKYCDPYIAANLFEEALDEFMLCDDQGLNVVAIEHHAGINSLFGANPLILGILARQTRKARILSLGTLVSLRPDPCLLYTSDAADEGLGVDLGGRRIIKKIFF